MSNETLQTMRFTQESIDELIKGYFDSDSIEYDNPTPHEIALMTRDLLNEYVNGDIDEARHAFNYFVGTSVENIHRQEQVKRIMFMLKQLNESNKSLALKYKVLSENYRTLQEEHEVLMEEYLA
jgi:hypothetical protein